MFNGNERNRHRGQKVHQGRRKNLALLHNLIPLNGIKNTFRQISLRKVSQNHKVAKDHDRLHILNLPQEKKTKVFSSLLHSNIKSLVLLQTQILLLGIYRRRDSHLQCKKTLHLKIAKGLDHLPIPIPQRGRRRRFHLQNLVLDRDHLRNKEEKIQDSNNLKALVSRFGVKILANLCRKVHLIKVLRAEEGAVGEAKTEEEAVTMNQEALVITIVKRRTNRTFKKPMEVEI